ncbi:GGDEF domain-containing protein [Demequina aestuarii]|uniref:GGDEF domain-containing protein n=1 Tax=Demequina aestuarii TaxID=327095 RepID=UPI000782A5C7|nr:GGDEF domain-containing protein [Demequina aestuarii]
MSGDPERSARDRHLNDAVERLLDRRVGRLTGEAGRAVSTTHGIAVIAIILTLSYIAFFMTYDMAMFGTLIAFNMVATIAYVACVLLARLGRQLGAALVTFGTAIVQLVMASAFVGWEAGFHLFILLACQLVFMVFTERQRALRWVSAFGALFGFLACQFLLPASGAIVQMPQVLLTTLFSINVLLMSSMLFIVAAVSHFRAERARQRAAELAARAEYLANTDALTGLANRRPVMERLEKLSVPGAAPYCLAIADLDHFKDINDRFGHACGDRVLADIGARLKASLRVTDAVGRWGGEEFVFVITDAQLSDAAVTMERIRASIGDASIACTGHDHPITVSIGLTDGEYDGSPHHAIRRADDALYASKAGGRDRVTVMKAPSAAVATEAASALTSTKPRRAS